MQFSLSNNPIDKLSCWVHNKKEELSQIKWIMGKHKECECRICGDKLNNRRDMYSPMQCGWERVGHTWICHNCLCHRNFRPFVEMVDEADRKFYEEHSRKQKNIKLKAQEIIDLLKEYLPEYKETLDLYESNYDLECFDADGYLTETDFSFTIANENEGHILDIRNSSILKVTVCDKKVVEIANYLDEDKARTCTFENPWTWDNAIEVIKKRIDKNIQEECNEN